MKARTLAFFWLGLNLVTTAYAEETNFGKQTPSVEQVIKALKPKTRSLNLSGLNAPVKKSAEQKIALSMEILFAYNSTELTADAKDKLKSVGEAMQSNQLQSLHFIVEGHTDAVGGDEYNKNLSLKRADSVKQYLVDTYQLDATRLKAEGKGKHGLLDPKDPDSEVNRRVRIVVNN